MYLSDCTARKHCQLINNSTREIYKSHWVARKLRVGRITPDLASKQVMLLQHFLNLGNQAPWVVVRKRASDNSTSFR